MGLLLAAEETREVVSVPWSFKYFLISGAVQNCHSLLSCATLLLTQCNVADAGARRTQAGKAY